MPKILMPNDIVNDTPADASPVEQNFNGIESFINTNLIERGGSVAMSAQLKLVGDPVAPLDAAPKQYVDAFLPLGIIMMYGGTGTPPGGRWAECNGAEVESATFPDLYAIIGNRYSPPGVPAGRFNLPNLMGRTAIGAGSGYTAGASGGSANAVVVPHTHPMDHAHNGSTTGVESAAHIHYTPDHLHHLGGNTGDQTADHFHLPGQHHGDGWGFVVTKGGSGFTTGGPGDSFQQVPSTHWSSNGHGHPLPGTTGPSDRSLATGGQSANHVHGYNTPVHNGNTGGASGAAASGTGANLPPYLAVSYIIRVS